mmetsp:Transcript_85957/g.195979  ORF Transcript_85957/g.195979 Transcript_85957/m.195979 type:complete len:242 (-) Transcript_85957:477-1202(-)
MILEILLPISAPGVIPLPDEPPMRQSLHAESQHLVHSLPLLGLQCLQVVPQRQQRRHVRGLDRLEVPPGQVHVVPRPRPHQGQRPVEMEGRHLGYGPPQAANGLVIPDPPLPVEHGAGEAGDVGGAGLVRRAEIGLLQLSQGAGEVRRAQGGIAGVVESGLGHPLPRRAAALQDPRQNRGILLLPVLHVSHRRPAVLLRPNTPPSLWGVRRVLPRLVLHPSLVLHHPPGSIIPDRGQLLRP